MQLGWIDLFVLAASIIAAIVIGLLLRGKSGSLESYLLGDRNLPWWAILGSIVATETSTATVLSVPGQGFGPNGMKFLQIAIGLIVGRLIVVVVLLPRFFDGKLFSAYEVLQIRFGRSTKYVASLLFLITRNLGDGLRLYLAAMVLEKLLGWPFIYCAATIGVSTILYTFFGGLRSVVWNDCIQLCIYLIGAIATVFIIIHLIPGGWATLLEYSAIHNKFEIFRFSPPSSPDSASPSFFKWLLSDPYSFWAGLLGGAVLTLGTHGTDQMMVQRYLSSKNQKHAATAIILSGLMVFAQFALFLFIGIELACYYSFQPETFEKADEVYAHFIINEFPQNTGLIGLMIAAILAAAMSTLSSSLTASASAVVNDFYQPVVDLVKDPNSRSALSQGSSTRTSSMMTDSARLTLSRWLAVGFGLLQIMIGILAVQLDSTVISSALTIAGYSAGLLLGLFLLGVLNRRANEAAALIGVLFGLAVLLLAQFVAPGFGLSIAWTWFAMLGSVTTFAIGTAVSLCLPQPLQDSLSNAD